MILSRLIAALVTGPASAGRANRARMLLDEAERLRTSGDMRSALAAFQRASTLEPGNAHIRGLLAAAYQSCGEPLAAEATYRQALALDPTARIASYNFALLLKGQRRAAEALEHLRTAHANASLTGDMLGTFVQTLIECNAYDEAARVATAATRADPTCRYAWMYLGLAHQKLYRPADALACYDRVLELGGVDAELCSNRAVALQDLGRWREAFASYDEALARQPDFPLARFHRGLALLATGDYERGWDDYEARLISTDWPRRAISYPRWHGENLREATLLIYGEQGLGDQIMFASCVPDAMAATGHCIIECAPALAPLFARSFPAATVYPAADRPVAESAAARSIDREVPIGSLPLYFRKSRAQFPQHKGYLRAAPERVAAWTARLRAASPKLKVGLSWRGGTYKTRSPLRSLELGELLPLLELPGVEFISLQYTSDARSELDALHARHGISVAHWPEAIADYDETAALVSALDLTISVCTSIVHLAGALGRPVWVMTPSTAEWRYGDAGERMPWYPSARLVRQERGADWSGVVKAIASALRQWSEAHVASAP